MAGILRIGVAGAMGRMGRSVIDLARQRDDVRIQSLLVREGHGGASADDPPLATREEALGASDVIIDFSTPGAAADLATLAAARGRAALVIGATGFSAVESAAILDASRSVPIVKSGNFSIGVNVLAGLVEQAARRLAAEDWDIEIVEAHHRRKRDAPSGTALILGDAAAAGRGVALDAVMTRARDGVGAPRRSGEIGFSSLRGGGIVGEHSVAFAAEEEIITLSHSARDRRLFARGALAAALWVSTREPGLYDMAAVLGFRE
jgi:4-hydroxy-tetrahydrodipicolinate reductase